MWIASKLGFFSIVQSKEDRDKIQVRARVRKDLENLIYETGLENAIRETKHTDYRFRIILYATELLPVMAALAASIDYCNFKSSLAGTDQWVKHDAYLRIWSIMQQFQPSEFKALPLNHGDWPAKPKGKKAKKLGKAEQSVVERFKSQIPLW